LTDLAVQWWPTERPTPYARNARVCPEQAVAKVAGSIREFGFRNPILVDGEGTIIAGHTRLLAAQRLGLETVPVIVCDDLSPAKVKALRLADNRTAQETSWDDELLTIELGELKGLDLDLLLTGFDEDELDAFLAEPTQGITDPDEVPEPPEEPISKLGDLWLLGNHRLLCGDCTVTTDVERVMDGKRALLMATDPPYLVDYDGGNHPQTWTNGGKQAGRDAVGKHWDTYIDHDSSVTFYRQFLAAALAEALSERPLIYQWFATSKVDIVLEAWRANGLLPHQIIIWHKQPFLARTDFMHDYEPCMYGWVQGNRPEIDRRPPANSRAVWDIDNKIDDTPRHIHPTMKPLETVRRPIEWHTRPGELIYEPFSGSGTAIIAAEMTGRRCSALELSPAFVDVAVTRWQNFTGQQATLEGDGRTFADLSAERGQQP
jgi:DNA modification methylase